MRKNIKYFLLLCLITTTQFFINANSQEDIGYAETVSTFYFDAIVFRADGDTIGRVDTYMLVPYQTLQFDKSGKSYSARYELTITVLDESSKIIVEKKVERKLIVEDYLTIKGGTGKFDYSQSILYLVPGKYSISALLIDSHSERELKLSRDITVLDFNNYNFSMSGILLVSSIEEKDGRFIITPHISDNVGGLNEGFFAFFECYNKDGIDSADFIYVIIAKNGETVATSKRTRKPLKIFKTQQYINIPKPNNIASGEYTLQIIALTPSDSEEYSEKDYLAITQRSINLKLPFTSTITVDIDKAIRQLRYVANYTDIEYMKIAETNEEKQKRFYDFWKQIDPTPNTEINEAYIEYYTRVDQSNKLFKSYNEGCLTDMGMIYIVFGPPFLKEPFDNYGDRRVYMRWTYRNNREFIFVDNSGFGDYRLIKPSAITEKYTYQN